MAAAELPVQQPARCRRCHSGADRREAASGEKRAGRQDGLPQNSEFLKELSQDLKRACGTGGTATEEGVELQGDMRDRVRDVLTKRNFVVKG